MLDTFTRADLLAEGWTVRQIARSVHLGRLIRVRRGHYATPETPGEVVRAVRVGGRLACVSELRHRGVWALPPAEIHVHVAPNAARLRSPDDRTRRRAPGESVVHWLPLLRPEDATPAHVGIVDALTCALGCLGRREAIAAIDSALNLGLVAPTTLRRVWRGSDLARLLDDANAAAQSGLETIVRLLATELGFRVRIQVRFAGIGVADILIEDWIVVETDGSEFHDGAAPSARDRRRDARHAAAGRTPLRFRYGQIVHELPSVAAAIIGAVGAHRRVRNSGRLVRRAVARARRRGLA